MHTRQALRLLDNIRFYILALGLLLSIGLAAGFCLAYPDAQIRSIRLEQSYGFIALAYWYAALLISPLNKFIGPVGPMPQLLFSRRAIGVSAAYFALLHSGVALWGQLGGVAELPLLPDRFKGALGLGLVGLLVLLVMAATSLDAVIRFMTYRRWKLLHRTGYIAGVLVLVHVALIGTHGAYPVVRWGVAAAVGGLLVLEAWRIIAVLGRTYPWFERLARRIKAGLSVLILSVAVSALSPAQPAAAHVVVSDETGQIGAVLHIEPDDDPVAGVAGAIRFYVDDVDLSTYGAVLDIRGAAGRSTINGTTAGGTVTAPFTFPATGAYEMTLHLTPEVPNRSGDPAYTFHAAQSVSRSGSIPADRSASPAAIAVLVISVALFLSISVLALSRRNGIAAYARRRP